MDITHYSFAFFVFVLACLLIWFYRRVSRGGKKNDQGSYEREQRLFRLYQNVEDMLNSFEEYAEAAKAEAVPASPADKPSTEEPKEAPVETKQEDPKPSA